MLEDLCPLAPCSQEGHWQKDGHSVGDPELQLFVSVFRQSLLMLFRLELPSLVCLLPPLNKVIGMSLSHNLY